MYTKHHTESENERLQTKAGQTLLVPYFFTSRRWFYVSTKIRKRYTLSIGIWTWYIRQKVEFKDNMRSRCKKVLRYSELRKEIGNITDAVLAASLKELISSEIIIRKSFDEIPPRVEYSLSEKGLSVVPILQSICKWSGAFYKEYSDHTMIQCRKCNYR